MAYSLAEFEVKVSINCTLRIKYNFSGNDGFLELQVTVMSPFLIPVLLTDGTRFNCQLKCPYYPHPPPHPTHTPPAHPPAIVK